MNQPNKKQSDYEQTFIYKFIMVLIELIFKFLIILKVTKLINELNILSFI